MEKVLNQQEIDAMVRAARSVGTQADSASGPVVQAWDVRQAGQIGSEQLRAINQLHELFARNLTNAVSGYLRVGFECGLVSAEHLTYREFLQRIPEKTYLASVDLLPVGAVAVLQLDIAIAFPIIDVMLGGEGTASESTRDITEIEEQVLEGIIRIMCRELQTSWQAISLQFKFGQRQQILQTQRLMPPEEKNLCLSFEIKMSDTRGTLNLAIPAVVSNALLRKISADFSYQRPRSSVEARLQIQKKMLNCFFPVDLSLSHLHVPLTRLTSLAPGDVIAFPLEASAPMLMMVGDVRLCAATAVQVNAHRAARVLTLELPVASAGEL
jgi:flagellar motor switch protein FliM